MVLHAIQSLHSPASSMIVSPLSPRTAHVQTTQPVRAKRAAKKPTLLQHSGPSYVCAEYNARGSCLFGTAYKYLHVCCSPVPLQQSSVRGHYQLPKCQGPPPIPLLMMPIFQFEVASICIPASSNTVPDALSCH